MPIDEDEHGNLTMNSRDLRAIEHVAAGQDGVNCFKIEGRNRITTSRAPRARSAGDRRCARGKAFDFALLGKLDNLANCGYTDGFFKRHHSREYQNYRDGSSVHYQQQFVGQPIEYQEESGLTLIEVKPPAVGDRLEIVQPHGLPSYDIRVRALFNQAWQTRSMHRRKQRAPCAA